MYYSYEYTSAREARAEERGRQLMRWQCVRLQALMSSLELHGPQFNEALTSGEHLLLASSPAKKLVQVDVRLCKY